MSKFFSLLRAVMSQDMELFKFKSKANSSSLTKLIVPVVLSLIVMFSVGTIYLPIAVETNNMGASTIIVLSIALVLPTMLAIMEGVYKSQSILFDSKDTEMLFALPISKKQILSTRIIKLYIFQLLYSLLFIVPGIVLYEMYEETSPYFYIITILMILLLPVIPTIIGCVVGFVVKKFSISFKSRKMVELIATMAILSVVLVLSFNSTNIMKDIIENSDSINNTIKNVYYPIGAYLDLLEGFNVITFITWLLTNIVPWICFVLIAGKFYFGLVSRSKENIKRNKNSNIEVEKMQFKQKNKMLSLIHKEFSRYFSSTVYVVNTLFGLVLLMIAAISLSINFDGAIGYLSKGNMAEDGIATLHMLAPKVYLVIVLAMSFMTSITSSSISIEGKTFNISKSLPVGEDKLLLAKIIMSDIITIPVIIICDIVFCISLRVPIIDTILIFIASFIAPSIAAIFGLLVNLKFPKMDASSDTEVVKQSMSSMISVLGGIMLSVVFFIITFIFASFGDIAMICEIAMLAVILLILWKILKKFGKKRFKEIES